MKQLERLLLRIGAELAEGLRGIAPLAQRRFVEVSSGNWEERERRDDQGAARAAVGNQWALISKSESGRRFLDEYDRDRVFGRAIHLAGAHGHPSRVLSESISQGARIRRGSLLLDRDAIIQRLGEIRQTLLKKNAVQTVRARLLGVRMSAKHLDVCPGIRLYRLSRRELNDRQPPSHLTLGNWFEYGLARHDVEIRVTAESPVDREKESAYLIATSAAHQAAASRARRLVDAIRIAVSGDVQLAPLEMTGPFSLRGYEGQYSFRPPGKGVCSIRARDLNPIRVAFDLLQSSDDTILRRSISRYVTARRRTNQLDRLVDYVIALESLLQTVDGNPARSELRFRFSINGASLLRLASGERPTLSYGRFLAAYDARSSIVHGSDERSVVRALNKAVGFPNLAAACDWLECAYRKMVFHLVEQRPEDRPYKRVGGWLALLWK